MRFRNLIGVGALFTIIGLAVRAQQSAQHPDDYIVRSEQQWAEASMKRDIDTVQRILADDFIGLDPTGRFFYKHDELASVGKNDGNYVAAKCGAVTINFYGDTAVARGDETWEKADGERGRYVWTDTWIRRSEKWQIVAAVDVKIPESSK